MDYIFSKPFLKWAGGKHKLVPIINEKLGKGRRLVEPFVGSGAVFMGTNFDSYLLCDANNDLIDLYNNLKVSSKELIKETLKLFEQRNNVEEKYYELREEFNNLDEKSIRKSALFIYLKAESATAVTKIVRPTQADISTVNKGYAFSFEVRKDNSFMIVTLLTATYESVMQVASASDNPVTILTKCIIDTWHPNLL